jgi:hypothetical protein
MCIVATLSRGRRTISRGTSRRLSGADPISWRLFPSHRTWLVSTGLLDHSVEVPAIWDALQLVLPGVLEDEA